ncbi:MAG: hypothetical protein E7448_03905 [Ruminococcaceae bacterium]|nr:hypothetical protein [Oscillospiraceae bacterium]
MKNAVGTPAEWRDIPGYDGAYQISWEGKVRTWRWRGEQFSKRPRILTSFVRKPRGKASRRSGREYVKLTDRNGISKDVPVLQLMVQVWFGGCPPGKIPYHKNSDTKDHCVNNIGFLSPKELDRRTGAKARRIPVAKVDSTGEIVAYYPSARAAARANHMSYQAVLDRCNGKIKKPYALDGHTYIFDR